MHVVGQEEDQVAGIGSGLPLGSQGRAGQQAGAQEQREQERGQSNPFFHPKNILSYYFPSNIADTLENR